MNAALYYHNTITDAQSVAMARRWVELDSVRVAGAAAAFVAALRALTRQWPKDEVAKDPPVVRFALLLSLVAVVLFVVWFVSKM